MPAAARPHHHVLAAHGWPRALPLVVVLVVAWAFVFADPRPIAIRLWDESRNVVNALEMARDGWSMVPRFADAPDLWNTKPPLLIWLMAGSVRLFGASEAALRLPATLATLGTVAAVFVATRRWGGGTGPAALAAALLVLSPGFFGTHGALTADYDALLTCFTTVWLLLFFRALHDPHAGARRLAPLAVVAAAALLTKGIAGAVPGAGALAYAVAVGRGRRLWRPPLVVAGAAAVLPVLLVVAVQEMRVPGFAGVMLHNDVVGRFGRSLVGEEKPWPFYLGQLWAGLFSATALLPLALPALARGGLPPRARLLLLFSLAVGMAQVAVMTAGRSKLDHYVTPALPFLAIAAALGIASLAARVRRMTAREPFLATGAGVALALVTAGAAVSGAEYRFRLLPRAVADSDEGYRALFGALAGVRGPVTVVDRGFVLEGRPHYAPVLRAYALLSARRGRPVRLLLADRAALPRGTVATCDARWAAALRHGGPAVAATPGCLAVRVD